MAVISPSSTGAGIKAFIDVFDEERLFSTGKNVPSAMPFLRFPGLGWE